SVQAVVASKQFNIEASGPCAVTHHSLHDVGRCFCTFSASLASDDREHAGCFIAGEERRRDFQSCRWRRSAGTADADAIVSQVFNVQRQKTRRHVRTEVSTWITEL